jgi:hypothetical protein
MSRKTRLKQLPPSEQSNDANSDLKEIREKKIFDFNLQHFDKKKMALIFKEIKIINAEKSQDQSIYYYKILKIFDEYFSQNDYTHHFSDKELKVLKDFRKTILKTCVAIFDDTADTYQALRNISDMVIDFELSDIRNKQEATKLDSQSASAVKFKIFYNYFAELAIYLRRHPADNLSNVNVKDYFRIFFRLSEQLFEQGNASASFITQHINKTRNVFNLLINLYIPHPQTFPAPKIDQVWFATAVNGISKSFKEYIFQDADSETMKSDETEVHDAKYAKFLKDRAALAAVFETNIGTSSRFFHPTKATNDSQHRHEPSHEKPNKTKRYTSK